LQGDDIADRCVFDRAKAVRIEATFGEVGPRSEQVCRAKEAADVIGAKRWR
jgi:hypothetical protein